jgi:hypothetical protein
MFTLSSVSQELNCELVVNAQLTGNENVQIFKTLETQLQEFINNKRWTNKTVAPQERINASIFINVENYDGDRFKASIQVSSSRPIFNSSYESPIYNFNDRDFNFQYLEFQNLNYSPTQFESNLVSVLAFHVYMILGMDADTFEIKGGQEYYDQARTIVGYSQQNNGVGWQPPRGGSQTRSALLDNIMSPTYKEYREVLYNYHRGGLDNMHENPKKGKQLVSDALLSFQTMNNRRPNSFILRVFFDAKAEEIEDVFSDGPSVEIDGLLSTLSKIAPMHASKWRNINF